MNCPRAALFDLDDTLAESFQPPKPEMIARLIQLLEIMPVGLITAAGFPRIETEFLDRLAVSPHLGRFYVFPNSSSQCYVHESGAWRILYSLELTPDEHKKIVTAIEASVAETGIADPNSPYKALIINREAQVAYAALGLDAPLAVKQAWDPDQSKRKLLKAALDKRIPEFEILIGGMTTIDITRKGVHKAYGVRWLSEHLHIPPEEMVFVGDAIYPGGNDYVVIPTGIQTHPVKSPNDTAIFIDEILANCTATKSS